MPDRTLLVAHASDTTSRLAAALEADVDVLPPLAEPDAFEDWRREFIGGAPRARIVVSVWRDDAESRELGELDAAGWRARFELPWLLWNVALGAAGRRCADAGALVALAQAPGTLDAAGLVPEHAIADGILALVRSVAAAEGARGVRANLVTTPIGLVEDSRPAPLQTFPGRLEEEVAGAVGLLLATGAVGLTGRALAADGGRAL